MQNTRCEALTVTGSVPFGEPGHEREGDRCKLDGTPVAHDGELRCLCWTHTQVAKAGTRELVLVPLPYVAAAE